MSVVILMAKATPAIAENGSDMMLYYIFRQVKRCHLRHSTALP
jgi:hypothetical protein